MNKTMDRVNAFADLTSALEMFLKGLTDCGLLTTYSLLLKVTSDEFIVEVKLQMLLQQLIKNLQNLLEKIGALSVENEKINTALEVDSKGELPSLNILPGTTDSLAQTCVLTENEETYNWDDKSEKHKDINLSTNSNTITSTSNILLACNSSSYSSVTPHNFIVNASDHSDAQSTNNIAAATSCNHSENSEDKCTNISEDASVKKNVAPHHPSEILSPETIPNSYLLVGTNEISKSDDICKKDCKIESEPQTNTVNESAEKYIVDSFGSSEKLDIDDKNVIHIMLETSDQPIKSDFSQCENVSTTYMCKICGKLFNSSRSLEIHLSLKHRSQGQCDLCSLRFNSVQSLQEHCRSMHNGAGCFNCPMCSRRFMTKLSYKRHLDTHGGKKGAVCDMCGKAFSRPDYLQKHYMTHNGTKPYECKQCPRKFVTSSQLKVHEKTHSGVKNYKCGICNKPFSRNDKLKDHMLRHLNIKRFQCAVCKRDYAEKRDLKKHLANCQI